MSGWRRKDALFAKAVSAVRESERIISERSAIRAERRSLSQEAIRVSGISTRCDVDHEIRQLHRQVFAAHDMAVWGNGGY